MHTICVYNIHIHYMYVYCMVYVSHLTKLNGDVCLYLVQNVCHKVEYNGLVYVLSVTVWGG